MKFLLLLLAFNWYTVTIQSKGGVRVKTTLQAQTQYQATQLAKQLYKDKIVISVVKQ